MSIIFLDGVNKKEPYCYGIIMFSFVRGPESILANDGKSTTKYVNRLNQKKEQAAGCRRELRTHRGVTEKIYVSRNASSTFAKCFYHQICSLAYKNISLLDSSLRAQKSSSLGINITMLSSALKCFFKNI